MPVSPVRQLGPTCPRCKKPVMEGEAFCIHCGLALKWQRPATELKKIGNCSGCGAPLYEGDQYCTNCRLAVSPNPKPPQPPVNPNVKPPQPPVNLEQQRPVNPSRPASLIMATPVVGEDPNVDHPTARNQLLRITRGEAQRGCRKVLRVEGRQFEVGIPSGVSSGAKLDVPGLGYVDEATGKRGPLRLSVRVVD